MQSGCKCCNSLHTCVLTRPIVCDWIRIQRIPFFSSESSAFCAIRLRSTLYMTICRQGLRRLLQDHRLQGRLTILYPTLVLGTHSNRYCVPQTKILFCVVISGAQLVDTCRYKETEICRRNMQKGDSNEIKILCLCVSLRACGHSQCAVATNLLIATDISSHS